MSFMIGSIADAQYCAPAVFVGDINQDNLVDTADVTAWTAAYNVVPIGSGGYTPCADLNRNGVLDVNDKAQLQLAVKIASSTAGGLGLKGRLPAFTISEFRTAQPLPTDPQQRFVEFRCPSSFPTNYNFSKKFDNGFYLLLVSRNNGTSVAQGAIRQVINLSGVAFSVAGVSANLALLKDSSFSLPIPTGLTATSMPAGQSITFPDQNDLNTTWFLVYRRPNVGTYVSTVAIPTIGQRVDGNSDCQIDARYTNSAAPTPNVMPPWDVIIDAISVDRSLVTTGTGGRGCIYAHGALFEIAPIGGASNEQSAFHVYRNSDNKNLSGIEQVVTTGIDTPGEVNPPSLASQFCGSETVGLCSVVHGPYCSDRECCEYVCGVLPLCCDISWDAGCVLLASQECGRCGGLGTGSCLSVHTSPYCSTLACCTEVCAVLPLCCSIAWDETCVARAVALCLECGSDVLANNCFQQSSFPYCSDSNCCSTVCLVDPSCCTTAWDNACVTEAASFCPDLDCGSAAAGDCCLSHGTPYCRDANCCQSVCAIDPYCCSTVWDVQCVTEVLQFCDSISCPCGGGGAASACFMIHPLPGCSSATCCNSVCNSDPFCCGVTWDASCVAAAETFCAGNPVCKDATGSCLVPHTEPGCVDPACCDAVCSFDPDCCNVGWDVSCVAQVAIRCGGCGDVFAGDCTTAHKSPHCDNEACCLLVCATDPYCCSTEWDSSCATQAVTLCVDRSQGCGDAGSRSCFVASFLQGCADPSCCQLICDGFDSYCCVVQWDAICVSQALTFAELGIGCTLPAGAATGRGDCLTAHTQKGCSDVDCSAAVCSIDPDCCRVIWDANCAELAPYVCINPGGCPGTGSSFVRHASPGSLDPACCNAVCFVMPECCTNEWDQACVTIANQRCIPDTDWNLPCIGSCIEVHNNPGCADIACASAVCFSDALCCTATWDEGCVSLARGLCCGLPGCGNACNGSCILPHDSPYCDNPFCCAAVCAEDPACCSLGWDGYCVKVALRRCATGCGNVESGSCFIGHGTSGCADARCCIAICRNDPFCCDSSWDSSCGEQAQADIANCGSTLECGDENAGDCCVIHFDSPKCRDAACCDAVCALDTENFCRDFAWDSYCVELALGSPECSCRKDCGDLCAGDCCLPHELTSCNDAKCCALVCADDSFCCEFLWDTSCAAAARGICNIGPNSACPPTECGDPLAGNCCIQHPGPSCRNLACCEAVCAVDAFCCATQWDGACAAIAGTQTTACPCTGPSCGSPETGSCFTAHTTPFCAQAACCGVICGKVQPECCTISWDASCVQLALVFCSQ